jgi:hypothetical protein
VKRILALTLLFAASLCGQSTVVISHPTPTVMGVTIGATYCYFYSQLAGPGSVKAACWLNGVLDYNSVRYLPKTAITGNYTFGWDYVNKLCPTACGSITWEFSPSATPNAIDYKISGTLLPDPGSEPSEVGTF